MFLQVPIKFNIAVHNIYRFEALKFMHECRYEKVPHTFDGMFEYTSNIHNYNTRYESKQNLHKPKVKSNTGKQAVLFILIDLCKELPDERKLLNSFSFIKQLKDHLLSSQRE